MSRNQFPQTTFGGSPLACCAGNAVLDVLEQDNLILAAREKGEFLEAELCKLKNQYPSIIKEVRGRGLMLALVMSAPPNELIAQFRKNGMLVVGAAENAIRFLPPLTISKEELSEAMEKTNISLKSFYQESEK